MTDQLEPDKANQLNINAAGAQIGASGETITIEGGVHATGDLRLFAGKITVVQPDPADTADWRNLAILRDKVKSFWIEGVLEKSVHKEVILELGKNIDLEAVEHPWERVLELPG
jgi:hypothetical protein